MIDRATARMASIFRVYFARSVTVGGLVGALVTLFAFTLVTIAPVMRATNGSWTSAASWKLALAAGWPAFAAAGYLRYSERYRRIFMWAKEQRHRRRSRKLVTGRALREFGLKAKAKLEGKEGELIRQQLLQAAASSVASILPGQQVITANFVVFCDDDKGYMTVLARSTHERSPGNRYNREGMAAWLAIKKRDVVVIDDVTTDERCTHMSSQNKNYRTIAAIPVTIGAKAFGAISLDASIPYLFHGKASDVALQLEPYIVLLSMTLDGTEPSEDCTYDPGHH